MSRVDNGGARRGRVVRAAAQERPDSSSTMRCGTDCRSRRRSKRRTRRASPDNRWIYFRLNREPVGPGVYAIDVETGEVTLVAAGTADVPNPMPSL